MPRQVVILHGWSDDSKSFRGMADFLKENGWDPVPLWLGDYLSMSDHVKIEDVVKRMDQVLTGPDRKPGLAESFDMIVHSTGGLVARKWIATFYPSGEGCPIKRLLMVAPANFGSKLASTGKSTVGADWLDRIVSDASLCAPTCPGSAALAEHRFSEIYVFAATRYTT